MEDGEIKVIAKFIAKGDTVFDVGANIGLWTQEVLKFHPDVSSIHLFEPVAQTYHQLLKKLTDPIRNGKLFPSNLALSDEENVRYFNFYEDGSTLSSFYRRNPNIERQVRVKSPVVTPVFSTTLDKYCKRQKINRIHFLKIDVEGGESDVLRGAEELLCKGKIDYLQFEYGGTYLDAKITLKQIFELLQKFRYGILKILPNTLEYKPQFRPEDENYEYSNFLAVNERLLSSVLGQQPKMLDIKSLCSKYDIVPSGVIHVGAHEGDEVKIYQEMSVKRLILIEANPVVFEKLKANINGVSNMQVLAANCAISNQNGTVVLRVTSADMSSSILPLKQHREIYPSIQETNQINVPSRTLDTLLQEVKSNPADFNLLNIDIQGAELFALQGATQWLKHVDAIYTEVNYEELYEGCALIEQIDDFLEPYGFERIATTTPYHPSWGDAFYVKKPVITMTTLGKNGRFANQLFQYAFLRTYAQKHNLRVETPAWIGQYIFGHNDPPVSRQLPELKEETNNISQARIPSAKEVFKNIDFWGYFQYNTKYYAPYKAFFRSLFKPIDEIEAKMQESLQRLRSKGKTIVGLHLRRGDYGYDHFFITPNEWYKEWLNGFWETLDEPVLFIASDEPDKILSDFSEYHPITSRDLGVKLPLADFYPDFYILSQCDILAISNSSFSFAASMLNEKGKMFFRPHLTSKKLIPFDPWNSETIFRDIIAEKTFEREKYLCLFLTNYYPNFLKHYYTKNPHIISESYQKQKGYMLSESFGDSDFYSEGLKKACWNTDDIIMNCMPLQQVWAKENNFSGNGLEILIEQIRRAKPQVVYLHDIGVGTEEFISAIRPYTQLIAGQIACPLFPQTYYKGFDVIFSSFPHFVEQFRSQGITSYWQPLAFDQRVLEKIGRKERIYPVTFVGGISPAHGKGKEILEKVAELLPVEFWGYGAESLPENSSIRQRHHGEAWGLDMFSVLSQSRITINRHIDVSENYANNMRLFEATGCGALLITDYKDNLNELFEVGKELIVYRSPEECVALAKYYLMHPDEAEKIARAGQVRTLKDHTYIKRMEQTSEILERHLRYKQEKNRFAIPDKISYGYASINPSQVSENMTSAWKSSDIPLRQRALVQRELEGMYRGKIPPVYQVLADCLRPHIYSGCSVLEIGCASGYYYEILEYILNKRITYTGVDYSEALIAMAKDYYPKTAFHVADGSNLPFEDGHFSIAISSCVLLHVPNYKEHIRETVRVAEKIVVAHRTPVCRQKPTQYFKKMAYSVETVELCFNENDIVSEFLSNGLKYAGGYQYHADPEQDRYEVTYVFQK